MLQVKRARRHENDLSNGKVMTFLNCLVLIAILYWTSGFWASIASQAAIQTVQAMNKAVVQTAGAMQTDKPDITEWTARPPFRLDDEDEVDEVDEDSTLDRL
jgi:hypothetical protein